MTYYISDDYLAHHGVKGMHWGIRKQRYQPSDVKSRVIKAKKDAKLARSTRAVNRHMYSQSFNAAYSNSQRHPFSQFIKGSYQSMKSDRLWNRANYDLNAYKNSNKKYKSAKAELKAAKKARKEAINQKHQEINKNASLKEKLVYNDATRRHAAKLITDNKNMSYETAMKKAKTRAWVNTAIVAAGVLAYADIKSGGKYHKSVGRAAMNAKDVINPKTISDSGRVLTKVAKNVYRP